MQSRAHKLLEREYRRIVNKCSPAGLNQLSHIINKIVTSTKMKNIRCSKKQCLIEDTRRYEQLELQEHSRSPKCALSYLDILYMVRGNAYIVS